jgi:Bacteriocin-protection, YdeI or OmpD-Associated
MKDRSPFAIALLQGELVLQTELQNGLRSIAHFVDDEWTCQILALKPS